MNNKAQIADTLTWIVALSIIVFILAAFMIGVVVLIPQSGENKLEFELTKAKNLNQINDFINVQYIDLSNPKPEFVSNFLDKNSKAVFGWADSLAFFNTPEQRINAGFQETDNPEAQKVYNDIFNAYTNLIKDYTFPKPYFYIRNGNKEMIIEYLTEEGKTNFQWRINAQEGLFTHSLRTDKAGNDPEYIVKNKFFLVSDNGTLIMIIFYDESEVLK